MAAGGTGVEVREDGRAMMRSTRTASIFSSIVAKRSIHIILIDTPFLSRQRYVDLLLRL